MNVVSVVGALITILGTVVTSIYAVRVHKKALAVNNAHLAAEKKSEDLAVLKADTEKRTQDVRRVQQEILDETSRFRDDIEKAYLSLWPSGLQNTTRPPENLLDLSLFDRRRLHFAPEKELLAETVVEKIYKQMEEDDGTLIVLVLDAGSTVFPIFQKLCLSNFQSDVAIAGRLKLVTNNLPGVRQLIAHGRVVGLPHLAHTLFECRVLSGYAHSQYEASLGPNTPDDLKTAISEFKQEAGRQGIPRVIVAGVTSGNYISIREGILARDVSHVRTKSTMLEVCDDIYVLSPLGKMLPYTCDEINDLLGLKGEVGYASLPLWPEKSKCINMIITTREDGYFIQLTPRALNRYFNHVQAEIFCTYKQLVRKEFDPMADTQVRFQASIVGIERALREYELPHKNLRERLITNLTRV